MNIWDKHTLDRVTRSRRKKPTAQPLANPIAKFVRREVTTRQKTLGRLGQAWQELLPKELLEHTCVETLHHGTLRVLVDNASSMFELNQAREQLTEQIRELCPTIGLSQIRFIRGRWYRISEEGIPIPVFRNKRPKKNKR